MINVSLIGDHGAGSWNPKRLFFFQENSGVQLEIVKSEGKVANGKIRSIFCTHAILIQTERLLLTHLKCAYGSHIEA